MFAGMMWSLASQQRRLLSGQKHISFSREPGLFSTHATATEGGGRRRRRPAESGQQQQQQSQQQLQDQRHGNDSIHRKSASRSRSRRTGSKAANEAREELLQQSASLGVLRAADLEGRQQQQQHSCTELPWSPQPVHTKPSKNDSSSLPNSPASSTASTVSDSSSLGSSIPSSSNRQASRTSSGTYSSSSSSDISSSEGHEDSSSGGSSSSGSSFMQLTEEEEAVIAATNRIARFMEFRERCASEVVTKLTELGYDKQFAYKVVKRMQETGQQDDARFAEMFVRGQWMAKSSAPSRIAYELRVRRVVQEHIDAALTAVFGDSKQIAGRESSDDSQEESWRKLVETCRQRVETTHMYPQQKRRAKLATWLQRRGHSLATAFRMFEELGI